MKRQAAVGVGMVMLAILGGCVSDVANRYYGRPGEYPVTLEENIQVLRDRPDRPFVVIADFQSRGENSADLRRKAADLGADAVIVAYLGGWYSTREEWASDDRYARDYNRIVGTAIKFIP